LTPRRQVPIVDVSSPGTYRQVELLVHDLTDKLHVLQALTSLEIAELDQNLYADHGCTELSQQPHGRRRGTARGKNIIHDQDRLAGLNGVGVDLERVCPVFEVIRLHDRGPGKLAGLAVTPEPGCW